MSKIGELYSKYAHLDTGKFDRYMAENLREELKSFKVGELRGEEEHKQYLELLRRFRIVVKEFTDLNGDHYLKTIKEIFSVGSSGMYSSELHFLDELIQNVDDCDYADPSNAKLNIRCGNEMTFEYNEKGFRPCDVFAITGIAEKNKNNDPNKVEIGEKGLGFKSVFGVAKTVFIQSGYFSFKLNEDDFTCPIPVYDNFEFVDGTRLTLFMQPGNVKKIFDAYMGRYQSQDALLNKNPLLFLNKLSELRVYFDGFKSLKFTVERRFNLSMLSKLEKAEHVKLTYEEGKDVHKEITCTHYVMPITYDREAYFSRYGENIYQSKKMYIQVIVPDLEFVKDSTAINSGSFYSFLPTKVELPVPIVCHVPFKLDPSREHIDSQKGNKWFVDSCNNFSAMFDEVLKDLAQTYREDIVYYLPKFDEYLFSSEKEYTDLELPYFKGEHFLTLPLFYTVTGGCLPADQVFAFSEPQKLQSPVRVAELLNEKRHLFNATNISIKGLNIDIIKNVTDKLFNIAFAKPEYAEEIFEILSNYEGFFYDIKIKERDIELDSQKLSAIFANDKCLGSFRKVAQDCLRIGSRPLFDYVHNGTPVDVRSLDSSSPFDDEDFGKLTRKYLSWIGYSSIIADFIPAGEFFIAKNVLLLSKDDTFAALSSFCRALDPRHSFAATLELKSCSKRLDEVDDSISAEDYLQLLRTVRKAIRDAFGQDVYNNYISLINQAGTNPDRYINELLQNADDCEYPLGSKPTLRLEISKDYSQIATRYNEKGFTKENVRAITAIGESTKKKLLMGERDAQNLIGEKGVGFKSVFAVAEKVAIYSGGFKFSLSDSTPTIPRLLQPKDGCESGTTMVFKLKEKMMVDFFTEEKVLRLCLCLRRLKHIKLGKYDVNISDKDGKRTIQINENIYEYKKIEHKFIVDDEAVLSARSGNKKSISREQKLLFYVPLNNKSVLKSSYLYSGLPTEIQIKVPLIIDAPFELDTSRENIGKSIWNDFVLNKLYTCLCNVLLELCKEEGINILKFINVKKLGNSYLLDLFSNEKLNKQEFLTELNTLAILPTWKDECFVSANKVNLYRIPTPISYALENDGIIGEDTSCFLNYRGEKYDDVLNALGIKALPLEKFVDMLRKCHTDYHGDEAFFKHLYVYLKDQLPTPISIVRGRLKKYQIIPVKGRVAGQTDYLSWEECSSKLYVKQSAIVSPDNCWLMQTSILEKSVFEYIFGENVNELTDTVAAANYREELLKKLNEPLTDEELYMYLMEEYKVHFPLLNKCIADLDHHRNLIPLKNSLGGFRKGKIYLSNEDASYFNGELIPSHIVHKECKTFAGFLQCKYIADVHHDDLELYEQLSADDIEDLQDSSTIHNGYEILDYCTKNGLISDELLEQYDLNVVFAPQTIDYDEDEVFNNPIKDKKRFDDKMNSKLGNPIRIEERVIPQTVHFGVPKSGQEFIINGNDRRQYVLGKYTLKSPMQGYCVCQMCKKAKRHGYIEVNNIDKEPGFHWKECGVALCLECSKRFEELRENVKVRERFHEAIKNANVNSDKPIVITIATEKLTFNQTHLAEIQQILKRQDFIS